jgi:hypothetical protein
MGGCPALSQPSDILPGAHFLLTVYRLWDGKLQISTDGDADGAWAGQPNVAGAFV